nr:unnamed protein product [Spirometra erinaceieuropaei]
MEEEEEDNQLAFLDFGGLKNKDGYSKPMVTRATLSTGAKRPNRMDTKSWPLKSDLGCSATELVFGTTQRLPGDMITPTSRGADETPDNLVHRLRQFMRSLSPAPPRAPMSESYVEKDMDKCIHVFVRCDRVRQPLESPYERPFRVLARNTKTFRILRSDKEDVVNVDRVKAAAAEEPPDRSQGQKCADPIPVAPENVPKTAVTTPFGLFEFVRMPFGFRNAAQTFQRFIDRVLRGLPFVYAYIDDLLMASRNAEEHKEHLALMFDRLDQFGVVINPSKCVLGVPSLDFLGHHVDAQGLRPLSSTVEAIRDFPPPTSKRQLQRFLGMVNFYRRFLPNCADLMLQLTNLLSGPKGPLELRGHALTAFERLKTALADATLLTHPAPEAPLSLMVDDSTVAVGAVLQQHINNSTRPSAFFSKKLSPAETRYSTFGRELLAIYLDVKHFRHFLEGRDFTIFTDHNPLTFAIRSHSDKYNPEGFLIWITSRDSPPISATLMARRMRWPTCCPDLPFRRFSSQTGFILVL